MHGVGNIDLYAVLGIDYNYSNVLGPDGNTRSVIHGLQRTDQYIEDQIQLISMGKWIF